MNIEYEIIDGKKYKKCKENQMRNPITKRCIKKKEVIKNEVKEKECPPNKIYNPATKRCVLKTSVIGKKLLGLQNSFNKKTKAANIIKTNMKKFLLPFINRISANIYDRVNYYNKIIKFFKLSKSNNNYCISIDSYNKEGKPIFKIGNNIILKKQIGSQSAHGAIYLSSFRDKNKKLFKYAIKAIPITYKTDIEVNIIEKLNKEILADKCPHFLISYGIVKCLNNPNITAGFPLNNKDYYVYLIELASGDFNSYNKKNGELSGNALAQTFISLMFYYKETKSYHCDAHNGNFLYHNIKKGGYFHYQIFKQDYYIENLGYLWIIWDYEQSVPLTAKVSNHNKELKMGEDFFSIFSYLYIFDKSAKFKELKEKLFNNIDSNSLAFKNYDKILFEKFIKEILESLCKVGFVSKTNNNFIIINKTPYIIDSI